MTWNKSLLYFLILWLKNIHIFTKFSLKVMNALKDRLFVNRSQAWKQVKQFWFVLVYFGQCFGYVITGIEHIVNKYRMTANNRENGMEFVAALNRRRISINSRIESRIKLSCFAVSHKVFHFSNQLRSFQMIVN